MSRRDRVSEAIRKEVSVIVHDKLNDPRLGFVTITGVELTPDLRRALISFSVLGNEEDYKKTKKALDSALGFIRSLVAQRINLRLAPEIVFKQDRSVEYSVRIQEVLQEIKEVSQPEDSPKPEDPSKKKAEKRKTRKELKGEPRPSSRGVVRQRKEGPGEPRPSKGGVRQRKEGPGEPRPSKGGVRQRKEGRGEPKKSSRLRKKV